MNGPQPPAGRHHGGAGGAVRVELRLAPLAQPPSAAERQAITTAVELALGTGSGLTTPEPGPWRFSGRWWSALRPAPLGARATPLSARATPLSTDATPLSTPERR